MGRKQRHQGLRKLRSEAHWPVSAHRKNRPAYPGAVTCHVSLKGYIINISAIFIYCLYFISAHRKNGPACPGAVTCHVSLKGYIIFISTIFIYYLYPPFLYIIYIHHFYILFISSIFIYYLYPPFLYIIYILYPPIEKIDQSFFNKAVEEIYYTL